MRAVQPLTKIIVPLHGGQTKTCQKNPFWEKKKNTTANLARNRGPNSKQLPAYRTRLYNSNKIKFKTKKKVGIGQSLIILSGSEGLDGNHLPYSLLYTTASLHMMLRPRAQALSYHVSTTYLFLPNSQAQ